MAVTYKHIIVPIVIILVFIWLYRKSRGLKGTWNTIQQVEEFAYIVNSTDNTNKKKKFSKEKESKGEKLCRTHLEKRLRVPFPRERPEFLKNPITNSNLELDCYSCDLKLGLEYNGKQHYEYIPQFHKNKSEFYGQKYRDDIKRNLCKKNGVDLIEVPYHVSLEEIPDYIDSALEKLGRIIVV